MAQMYGGYPAPYPPPPRKSNTGKIILIVVGVFFALMILLFGGCALLVGTAVNEADKEINKKPHVIRYEVSGSAKKASIGYGAATNLNQIDVTSFPWSRSENVKGWTAASLTVTHGAEGGHSQCKIYVDDKLVQSGQADGPFGTASCIANTIDPD